VEINITDMTVKKTSEVLPEGAGVTAGGFVGTEVGDITVGTGDRVTVGIGVTVLIVGVGDDSMMVGIGVPVGMGVALGVGVKVTIGVADGVADCATCVPPANTTKLAVMVFEIPYWSRV
jgi:hypothetical protein